MLETPSQPPHAAELALVAGFILVLLLEAIVLPAGGPRKTGSAGTTQAAQAGGSRPTSQAAPPLPQPLP